MSYKMLLMLLSMLLVPLCASCGGEEPSGSGEYYPMSVGDYWVYEETGVYSGSTTTLRYEVTGEETLTLEHADGPRDVFVVENTFPGTSDEYRLQYVEDDGTRAVRIKHEIFDATQTLTKVREYDPGFLRFDRSRIGKDEQWTEELVEYTDTLDGTPVQNKQVQYQYKVIDRHQTVTVEAGTFDCLVIERSVVYGTVGEVKVYYFAPGVGKIKEITENDKEENLVAYQVAKADEG